MTLGELRERLRGVELIPETAPQARSQPVWYLRAISGCGAWLACLFLLIFWLLMTDARGFAAVLGLAHCALACGLAYHQQGSRSVSALSNLALALWFTGLPLIIVGMLDYRGRVEESAMTAAVLGLASLCYPEWLGRLMTMLASGFFAVTCLCYPESPFPPDLFLVFLPLLAGVAWLGQGWWWSRGWGSWASAFGYASLATLWMVLGAGYWDLARAEITLAGRLSLIAMVLWLVSRILYRLRPPPLAGAWALGGTLLVAVLTHQFPGILAGLGVLLLGFEVNSPGLIVMAVLYWAQFLPAYFYDLEISLTAKALLMGLTGGVLLLLRRLLLKTPSAESEIDGP